MIKADDKVHYDGCDKPEKFTHFEQLQTEVEILKSMVNEQARILRENDLHYTEKVDAEYFDDDQLYNRLEDEIEEDSVPEKKSKK